MYMQYMKLAYIYLFTCRMSFSNSYELQDRVTVPETFYCKNSKKTGASKIITVTVIKWKSWGGGGGVQCDYLSIGC